jgi:hypothetical protein
MSVRLPGEDEDFERFRRSVSPERRQLHQQQSRGRKGDHHHMLLHE